MSEAGKRLIASANDALDLVKRLRDGCNLQQRDGERAADRIEHLERELAAERARNEKNKTVAANATVLASERGFEIEELQAELAAEKALADRLAVQLQGWWDCADTFPWRDGDDRSALDAYRKARGL